MMTIVNYSIKFFSVVVVNCLEPANIQSCLPVHEWLFPEVLHGIEILRNPDIPYKTEREYLKNLVNSEEL
jgi:hypothetical protein